MEQETVRFNARDLTKNQQKVANFLEKNMDRVPYLTEQDIATEVKISVASVSRFWKVVGYENLKQFKRTLQQRRDVSPSGKIRNTLRRFADEDLFVSMMQLGAEYIERTADHLDPQQFAQAVAWIAGATRVHVHATGPSRGLGYLLEFRLNRLGIPVTFIRNAGQDLFESIINIASTDIAVVFGFVRMLPEQRVMLEYAREAGFRTILITDLLLSEMHDLTDCVLFTERGNSWEFHSMVAPTLLVESLVVHVGRSEEERSMRQLEQLSALRKRFSSVIPR
jgi:DNA-binding MurR/RpiR family transcriptional regulator